VLGIGGGGDVVGALSSALLCERLGTPAVLGGVTWERLPVDPLAGPRPVSEIVDGEPLADAVLLARPQTRTAGGAVFAESRMARLRDEPTVLVDVGQGPRAVAEGLERAAVALETDLLILVDVGGDVLGEGSEPGLASPLCDAVMLAAGARLQRRGMRVVAAVFGPCCDGELTMDELLGRIARLAAEGGLIGVESMSPEVADALERASEEIPTEASAQAIRCARGEIGVASIRAGRRQVPLSPFGALTFYFDPETALASAAPLAREVIDARDLEQANDLLHGLGVRTELDYERSLTER
jgi:hypothetical protein